MEQNIKTDWLFWYGKWLPQGEMKLCVDQSSRPIYGLFCMDCCVPRVCLLASGERRAQGFPQPWMLTICCMQMKYSELVSNTISQAWPRGPVCYFICSLFWLHKCSADPLSEAENLPIYHAGILWKTALSALSVCAGCSLLPLKYSSFLFVSLCLVRLRWPKEEALIFFLIIFFPSPSCQQNSAEGSSCTCAHLCWAQMSCCSEQTLPNGPRWLGKCKLRLFLWQEHPPEHCLQGNQASKKSIPWQQWRECDLQGPWLKKVLMV